MKRFLYQFFCLLMTAVVLLTSTGFGLVEHSCMVRGKKTSLAIARSNACEWCHHPGKHAASTKPSVRRGDCCQEEQRYENVSFSSSISQLVAKFIKSVADLAVAGATALVQWLVGLFAQERESSSVAAEAPPLLHGRGLLVFVQRFLL